MSVRHVHAKPGEYIAVHRNHGGGGGGTSGDGMGCLTLVAVGFAIWLIWFFRAPLGKAIGWSAKHLWSFITWSMSKIGMTVSSAWMKFKNRKGQNNTQSSSEQHPFTPEYNSSTDNYGKIIQNRK